MKELSVASNLRCADFYLWALSLPSVRQEEGSRHTRRLLHWYLGKCPLKMIGQINQKFPVSFRQASPGKNLEWKSPKMYEHTWWDWDRRTYLFEAVQNHLETCSWMIASDEVHTLFLIFCNIFPLSVWYTRVSIFRTIWDFAHHIFCFLSLHLLVAGNTILPLSPHLTKEVWTLLWPHWTKHEWLRSWLATCRSAVTAYKLSEQQMKSVLAAMTDRFFWTQKLPYMLQK